MESRSTQPRAPSRVKYGNDLVDMTFAFNEVTKDIQKYVKKLDVSAKSTEELEVATHALQELKTRYTKVIAELRELFFLDKWDESKEVQETVKTVSPKYLKLLQEKILEVSRTSRNDKPPSKRSSRSARTRLSKASSSVERQKALTEVAVAQKQVEFDILITKKEKERKELEASEERKRVEAKARYDHEIAVLMARKKAATAEAKLIALEQFIEEEESEFVSDRSPETKINVNGISEAGSLETRYYTRSWIISQQSNSGKILQDQNPTLDEDKIPPPSCAKDNHLFAKREPIEGDLASINKKLTESLARISLPKCHPEVYNGDLAMFYPWKSSFEGMIRDCRLSPDQEMNYMSMYTAGEPRRLVNSFRRRHTSDTAKLLKDLWLELEARFGNAATITNELLKRLRQSAKFQDHDRKKLQAFSDLCADVASQMTELPGLSCLNYPNVLQPMFKNPPVSICCKWEEKVVEYALKNKGEYPEFSEFASFIKKRALLKNHPNAMTKESNERREKDGFEDHIRSYKGNTNEGKDGDSAKSHCPFHDVAGHALAECKAFSHKTLQERIDWLKQAGLCFLCSTKGHLSKECKQTVKCTKCGSSRHQTILHREKKTPVDDEKKTPVDGEEKTPVDGEEITSKQTNIGESVVGGPSCSKILLLDIYHPKHAQNVVRTFAVIDEQSNASMVSPALLEKLGMSGKKEKYYLSTCSGSRESKYGCRASGLFAKNLKGIDFKLPTLVECDNIPSDKGEIPTPEKVKAFAHLRDIAKEIPPMDEQAEIQLLIGRDAPELMKIRAFRNGPKGTPWAH